MSRRFQSVVNVRHLAYAMIVAFVLMFAGRVSGADNTRPEGTKGWLYYIDIWRSGYAASPEEACRLTAKNHMGTALVDMSAPYGPSLLIGCKYPHFLQFVGPQWY